VIGYETSEQLDVEPTKYFVRVIKREKRENQRYRASGLNLVVAAIALWNTVYLERRLPDHAEAC
jgi:hypothetical protein